MKHPTAWDPTEATTAPSAPVRQADTGIAIVNEIPDGPGEFATRKIVEARVEHGTEQMASATENRGEIAKLAVRGLEIEERYAIEVATAMTRGTREGQDDGEGRRPLVQEKTRALTGMTKAMHHGSGKK